MSKEMSASEYMEKFKDDGADGQFLQKYCGLNPSALRLLTESFIQNLDTRRPLKIRYCGVDITLKMAHSKTKKAQKSKQMLEKTRS